MIGTERKSGQKMHRGAKEIELKRRCETQPIDASALASERQPNLFGRIQLRLTEQQPLSNVSDNGALMVSGDAIMCWRTVCATCHA